VDTYTIGFFAGVTTSFLWTLGSLWFSSAGKRIGSFTVNAYRILIATVLLVISNLILLGSLPVATSMQWFWMGLSGIVGLVFGDLTLITAYVVAGPRLSLLVMTTSAIFAALAAYLMLGEIIQPLALLGVVVTLMGILIAVLAENKTTQHLSSKKTMVWGLSLALCGAIGQGVGAVLSKIGMLSDPSAILNPLAATLMRMLIGGFFIWTIAIISRRLHSLRGALSDTEGMKKTVYGSIAAPYLGVTLSLVALASTPAGVAQTLMSLMPIFIIPIAWAAYRQKTGFYGIVGAAISIIGVAIISLTL
jgi:drug/metabolite transporter (DMT)-like permease